MAQTTTQKVPIFNAPDRPLSVPATGVEQLARAGARMGQFGNVERALDIQGGNSLARGVDTLGKGAVQIGDVLQKHDNLLDLTNINNAHAATLMSLQQAHDTFFAQANPLDPNVNQEFQSQVVDPAVQNLRGVAQTKVGEAHAEELASGLQDHFAMMGNQTQARRLGDATAASLQQQFNTYSAAVQKNPRNLPNVLSAWDSSWSTYAAANPELDPVALAKERQGYRQHMIATALKSGIDQQVANGQTPDLSALTNGHPYAQDVGGPGMQTLQDYAKGQVRVQQVAMQRNTDFQQGQQKLAGNQAIAGIMTQMFDPAHPMAPGDATKAIIQAYHTSGQIVDDGLVKSALDAAKEFSTNPKGAHDDATFNTMMQRSYLPEGDPNQLTYKDVLGWYGEGKLTNSELAMGNSIVERQNSAQHQADSPIASAAMESVKAQLNPTNALTGGILGGSYLDANAAPGTGMANYARWMRAAQPAVAGMIAKGMTASEAWGKVTDPSYLQWFKASGASNLSNVQSTGPQAPTDPAARKANLNKILGIGP